MASLPTASSADTNLDIQGARVAVQWTQPDGRTSFLCSDDSEAGQIAFDCHFRPQVNTASFRLRAPLLLKGFGRKTTPFYMFFPSERVESLVCSDLAAKDVVDTDVRNTFGGDDDIVSLRFTLRQLGDLVVPLLKTPLVPKKKAFWDLFDSLKMLAQESSFVVYLAQKSVPSRESLLALCDAVTAGKLTASVTHMDIGRLYDGKGGKVLACQDLDVPTDLPPSYGDVGPSPPGPPVEKGEEALRAHTSTPTYHVLSNKESGPSDDTSSKEHASSSSRKRRRASSAGSNDAANDMTNMDAACVEAICRKMMNDMTAKWRVESSEQVRSEVQQMEARVKDWMDARLRQHADDLRAELRQTSVELQNHVHDTVGDVSNEVQEGADLIQEYAEKVEEVERKLETSRDATSDLVDERLDERIEVLRGEMEEFVGDQLHDAENRVIQRLRDSVYIDFGIYE